MKTIQSTVPAAAVLVMLLGAFPASAAVTQAGQSTVNPNRRLLWSQFGSDGTEVPNAFRGDVSPIPGVSGNVSTGQVTVQLGKDPQKPPRGHSLISVICTPGSANCQTGWGRSNLTPGESVLWTADDWSGGNGPVTLYFGTGVEAAGAWVEADAICPPALTGCNGAFTVQIEAFGADNQLLGTFTNMSSSTGGPTYIGVNSTTADITAIRISLTKTYLSNYVSSGDYAALDDFAVSSVDIRYPLNLPPAPLTSIKQLVFANGRPSSASTGITAVPFQANGINSTLRATMCGPTGKCFNGVVKIVDAADGKFTVSGIYDIPGQWTATLSMANTAPVSVAVTIFAPTPIVTGVLPSAVPPNGGTFVLTVTGYGFIPSSKIRIRGAEVPTTFVSPNRLTTIVTGGLTAGRAAIAVSSTDNTNTWISPVPVILFVGGGSGGAVFQAPTPVTSGGEPLTLVSGNFTLRSDGLSDLASLNRCSAAPCSASSAPNGQVLRNTGNGTFTGKPVFSIDNTGKPGAKFWVTDGYTGFLTVFDTSVAWDAISGSGDGFSKTDGSFFHTAGLADVFNIGLSSRIYTYGTPAGEGRLIIDEGGLSTEVSTGGSLPSEIVTADFNSDGVPDIAVLNRCNATCGDGSVAVFTASNGGTSGTITPLGSTLIGLFSRGLVAGNFTGHTDGVLDLAVSQANEGGQIVILKGDGTGKFAVVNTFASMAIQNSLVTADFNNDGFPDLAHVTDTGLQFYYGDGTGNFRRGNSVDVSPRSPRLPTVADFNGDGRADIAFTDVTNANSPAILFGKAPSGTTVSVSAAGVTFGANVNVAIAVAGIPSGALAVQVDTGAPTTVQFTNGQANVTLPGVGAGTHTITATYAGDVGIAQSSGSVTVAVAQATSTTTISPIAVALAGTTAPVVVTVASAAGIPGGLIDLKIDNDQTISATLDAAGKATFNIAAVRQGRHTLTASYNSPGNYSASIATASLIVVGPGLSFRVFGTGLAENGAPLDANATDPHYSLVARPDGNSSTTAVAVSGHPAWFVPPAGTARWISLNNSFTGAGGDWTYRTTFNLTGFDPASATLIGTVASDDTLVVKLNGTVIPNVVSGGFASTATFVIRSGFVAGNNTLDFVVNNGSAGPTGLRVAITSAVASRTGVTSLPLYGTGVHNANAALAVGATDPHYSITARPDGNSTTAVVASPNPAWIQPPAGTARWISVASDTNGAAGNFTYRTTFSLNGYDPSTVAILGTVANDDELVSVKLNGNAASDLIGGGFSTGQNFGFNSGFVAGQNTLDFTVSNAGGPTGLRVTIGYASGVFTPPTACAFSLSPTTVPYPASGGLTTLSVTASAADCPWTATSNSPFLTVSTGASGNGSGTVSIRVGTNTTAAARSGTVTVAGQTFTVNQLAGAPACSVTLSTPTLTVGAAGQSGTLNLTVNGGSCAWAFNVDKPFVQVFPTSGNANATIYYTIFPNFSTLPRSSVSQVGSATLTVNQAAATGTSNERFVQLVYFAFLGRLPSAAELAFQVGAVNGGLARADLAMNFFRAAEFNAAGRFVAGLYVGILNRDAEYGGWLFQRTVLSGGGLTQTQSLTNFITSAEFVNQHPGVSNEEFVRILYRQILLREPSSAEVAFQAGALNGGAPRPSIATNFLNSQEFIIGTGPRLTSFLLYACLLQRDPTQPERDALIGLLQGGAQVRDRVLAIINGTEFQNALQ